MTAGVNSPHLLKNTRHTLPLRLRWPILALLMFFAGCAQPDKGISHISTTPSPAVGKPGYITHKVERGETVWAISKRYDVSPQTIIQLNGIKDVTDIDVGTELLIPGTASSAHAVTTSAPTTVTSASVSSKGFIWPISGKVLKQYGDIINGHKNGGIDIEAQVGQDVLASNGGVVEVVTENPDGWGKVVVIRHNGGLHTWYAHNSKILVSKGSWVKRGQVIAQAGQTGSITRPELHFKVFKDDKPINPLSYLPSE
ncbi:MAG: M23 family metallopeptidase [Candidatus Brocadiales bacterium]|nr:M23 family metallopeptidase [Candidatus Brocadiales bacterium]